MLVDLLKATTTTTGTGAVALARKNSFPMPSDHPIFSAVNGLEIGYSIKTSGGVVVETGIGTLSSNGASLARTYVHTTWAAGTNTLTIAKNASAVNLTESSYDVDFGLNAVNVLNSADCRDGATNRVLMQPNIASFGSSTIALTAYVVYYIPFEVKSLSYVSGFCVRHSGATAPNYVFALHQRKNNGNPGPIIYSSASAAIGTLEGVNNFPFTAGNKMIPAGQYFISMCCDATDTIFRANGTSSFNPTTMGANSTTHITSCVQYLTETITAPLAIPASHGTLAEVHTSYVPVVSLKSA